MEMFNPKIALLPLLNVVSTINEIIKIKFMAHNLWGHWRTEYVRGTEYVRFWGISNKDAVVV